MKWFKRGAIGFLVLTALYFGAIELIKRQFEPESFRQMLVEYVQREFNAKLEIFTIQTAPFSRFGLIANAVKLEGGGMLFSVEKATFTVSPLPLLFGRVVITNLSLKKPTLLLRRLKTGKWNYEKLFIAAAKQSGPTAVMLKKVLISGGTVTIIDEFVSDAPVLYKFSLVDALFRSQWLKPSSYLLLSARMQSKQEPSRLKLKLYSGSVFPFRNWMESTFEGKVHLQSVKPEELQHYIGRFFPKEILKKHLDFNMTINGIPSKNMAFESELLFRPGDVKAGASISADAHKGYRRIEADGTLSTDDLAIERLAIVLPEITLKGAMDIKNYLAADPEVQFRFQTSFIDISKLAQLVPPAYQAEPMIRFMEKNIERGQFRLTEASFAGPYSRFLNLDDPDNLGMLSGKMEIKDFTLKLETFTHPVEHLNGEVLLKPGRLSFSGIRADYGKNRLKNISGDILNIHSEPLLKATIDADLDLNEFQKELLKNIGSPELSAVFKPVGNFSGKIGFNFNIVLDLHRQLVNEFDGEISLHDIGFTHDYFHLPVKGLNGSFRVNKSNIFVHDVTWKTGSTIFNVEGRIKDYPSSEYYINFSFDINGELSEFAKSRFYTIPYLEDLKGTVSANLQLEGDYFEMKFSQKADFTKAEYGLHGLKKLKGIASRQRLSGSIYEGSRMRLDYGELVIGKLMVSLSGNVKDITKFDGFKLDIKLKRYELKNLWEIIPSFKESDADGYFSGNATVTRSKGITDYKYWFNSEIEKLNLQPFGSVSPFLSVIRPEGVFTGWIKAIGDKSRPLVGDGEVKGVGFGFKTKFKEPFQGFVGKGTLKGDIFEFRKVHGRIGDSKGTVSGSIKLKPLPEIELYVDAEQLNLYDMVGIKAEKDGEEQKEKKKPKKVRSGLHPTYSLSIRAKQGTIHMLDYQDLEISFDYFRSNFTSPKFSFVSHGGQWNGDGTLSLKDGKQLFEVNLAVSDLSLKTFLPILWPGTNKLTGKLDLQGMFTGEDLQWSKLRHSLGGEAKFKAKKGMLAEHPGAAAIFTLLNVVPIFETRTKEQEGVGIPYETITGTMKIKDGVGHSEDSKLEGSVVRMSAVGDVMFNDGTVDVLLGVKPFTTIDKIISKIPLAGRILTGDEKSLITHYYEVTGKFENLNTKSVPSESLGRTIFGIFKRIMEVPAKALSIKPKKEKTAKP